MALLAALGHVANLGQFVEIGQGHAHQREQIRWTRRNYALDAQALKIDLLGAARDDVRGTYDTYVERLDSLLLLNALLLPFALNTLQFSDQFVPGLDCLERPDPNTCIEVRNPIIHTIWVYLVGIDLFVPFWSILMLLQCKKKLDGWLQQTLDDLQQMRKAIISTDVPEATTEWTKQQENDLAEEQKRVVANLGGFIVDYQDLFMELWNSECSPLVQTATRLLWSSATIAIALTAFMFWIYLADRDASPRDDHIHFAVLTAIGLGFPIAYFFKAYFCKKQAVPHVPGAVWNHQDLMSSATTPMAVRRASMNSLNSIQRQGSSDRVRRASSDMNFRPTLRDHLPSANFGSEVSTSSTESPRSAQGRFPLLNRMSSWRSPSASSNVAQDVTPPPSIAEDSRS